MSSTITCAGLRPPFRNTTVQFRESRRAFIAGARRLYIYMTQGVVKLSDDAAEKEPSTTRQRNACLLEIGVRRRQGLNMKPTIFPEKNVVFAEHQPEYLPLPAHRTDDGQVITRWEFSWQERLRVAFGRPMWLRQLTFNHPLQPLSPTVESPFTER